MSASHSILVVDDEPNLRQSLALILQREGYQVTGAGSADEALHCLEAGAFDFAFLDIKMPGVDGITLLRKVRTMYPAMVIFMLTAHATLDTAIQAVHNGANDYLLKPIEPGLILDRVRQGLEKQQQPRRRQEITSQMQELVDELQQIDQPGAPKAEIKEQEPTKAETRYLQRGVFTADLHTHNIHLEGRILPLPPSTFNFFVVLLRHSPNTVTYEILVREAQGYNLNRLEARELTRGQIHELRKVLEPDLRHPCYIITIRDVGYRLVTGP